MLACGFLKSSFVPQRGQRQLRDLTRHRAQLHGEHTQCANRIQKVLQDANIELLSVATDILSKSGRDILATLTVLSAVNRHTAYMDSISDTCQERFG